MIKFIPVEELTISHLTLLKSKDEDMSIPLLSRPIYECWGKDCYGLLGMYSTSLLSHYGVLWFVPSYEFVPTREEIRFAKTHVRLSELFNFGKTLYADVPVGDHVGQHFARFFGMEFYKTSQGYHIYKGVA